MQIVPIGDNLHEMSKPVFLEKIKYFNMPSVEILPSLQKVLMVDTWDTFV